MRGVKCEFIKEWIIIVRTYRDLDVFRGGYKLSLCIYKLTTSYPKEELYGITSQIRRAAVSVVLNIAEGYGKQETSGYSIEVAEIYETENAIYVQTDLIGPSNDEKIVERPTYPYIVLKTESIDKNVVFR